MKLLRRMAPAIMPLAYLGFTLLVYWRMWTPIDSARGFFRYDPRFEYWGDLLYQWDTLGDGVLALWNPHDRGGFPIYGDPQPGMLYPGNWPFLLIGALADGVSYFLIGLKVVAHWAFGAIGMHLFLRRLGAREPGCYVGGVLFGWTCPRLRYGGSALNWSMAWIPWILLAVDWFAAKPSLRRAVVLGTVAAMPLLTGAPAVVLYAAIIAVPYLVYLMWGRLASSWRALLAAAAVALLWVLPLIASNLQQVPESVREQRSLGFITDTVFSSAHFVSFLVPRLGGENIYYGLFPLLCVGLLVASAGRTRSLLFLAIAAVGVGLALGNNAGLLPAAASVLPPFGFFRRAHRYLYITSIAVAVLAGLGLARALTLELERRQQLARAISWVGGAVTFAIGIAYLISVIFSDKLQTPKNVSFGLAFMSAAAGTWVLRAILINQGRRQLTYAWIAVVIVAVDVWTANAKIIDVGWTPPPAPKHDALVAELADTSREWRVYDRGYLDFRPGTRLGIRDFGGYEDDPLGLSRYKLLLDAGKKSLPLLGHANVRYYLAGNRRPAIKLRPGDKLTTIKPNVYELPAVAPAVMYVANPTVVADAKAGLRALRSITPGRGAVVEGKAPPRGAATAEIAAGHITTLEPNRLVAEIDAPGPGLIVIAEAYFPAWEATVNGEPVTIQPANVMFRGVPVDAAGHYRIEMRLRPLRFWGLLPAYFAAFALFIWAAIVRPWRRRRRPSYPRSSRPPKSDPPTATESA